MEATETHAPRDATLPGHQRIEAVRDELAAIRAELVAGSSLPAVLLEAIHANFGDSARNLLHYLALRRRDLRQLQRRLASLGLSSLGRAESHVLATVDAVLELLHHVRPGAVAPSPAGDVVDFARGQRLLAEHTEALLGPPASGRTARIMVTMPSEAAHDYSLVHDLLQQGMDCMRINCAHDDPAAWSRMIENLTSRRARGLGRSCRVMMDLGGPKLRTGPVEPGPAVVRIRPQRDASGRVMAPARVWLHLAENPSPSPTRRRPFAAAGWMDGGPPGRRAHQVSSTPAAPGALARR